MKVYMVWDMRNPEVQHEYFKNRSHAEKARRQLERGYWEQDLENHIAMDYDSEAPKLTEYRGKVEVSETDFPISAQGLIDAMNYAARLQ